MSDRVIKVVVLDFDGTLVPKDRPGLDLDDTTVDLLSELRKRNIFLFVATGRHPSFIEKRIKRFDFDAIVGYSGNVILHGDEVNFYKFKKADIKRFYDFFKNYPDVESKLYSPQAIATCQSVEAKNRELERLDSGKIIDLNGVTDFLLDAYLDGKSYFEYCRYTVRFKDFSKREAVSLEFSKHFADFHLVKTGDKQVEILYKNYSKASRLKELARRLGIDTDAIVTVGDDENDYEMLKEFESFYVGDSANERLRKAATFSVSSCKDALNTILESRK